MQLDITIRDIILVFSPILLVNIWSWYKSKSVKKQEISILRRTFINELLRIEAKLKIQSNLLKDSKEKYHIQPHYFGIESFNNEISWFPNSKIVNAFVINSKYTKKLEKSFRELITFTILTNTFETYASLRLIMSDLRAYVNENIDSEKKLIQRWTNAHERLVELMCFIDSDINSKNLILSKNIQMRLSKNMKDIHPYLDFLTHNENKKIIDSFNTILEDSNKLTLLIPTIRQMIYILNEFESLKPSVHEKLNFYIESIDKCSNNVREAADSLQKQTKIKKFWQIN
jgi:hypothetical protein